MRRGERGGEWDGHGRERREIRIGIGIMGRRGERRGERREIRIWNSKTWRGRTFLDLRGNWKSMSRL